MKVHYVYQIENLINGKIYIGKHSTDDVDDGYMGSGILITKAICKYGIENFRKNILAFFDSAEQALDFEKSLVTEEFVLREDTYNITCGGSGSWFAANRNEEKRKEKNRKAALAMNRITWKDPAFRERALKRASENFKRMWEKGDFKPYDWTGQKHKEESKAKIGKANSVHQSGSGNSNYGNVWVHNLELKVSKLVSKEQLETYLDTGWKKGRKMKW
jgi:hypothetical protein